MRVPRSIRDRFLQHEMRTYGRKNGYITPGQAARLQRWLPRIELVNEARLGPDAYPAPGPIVMEIGFGNGEFLAHLAVTHPAWNLFGVEIYLPGIAKAISRLEGVGALERVRISRYPAQYVLAHQVADETFDGVYINHPDPWPKARHAKRRLIQPDFAALLVRRMRPGAFLKLATDWPDLAEWMLEVLDRTPGLRNLAGRGKFAPREEGRIVTKFERRGMAEGRESLFLHYVKEAS